MADEPTPAEPKPAIDWEAEARKAFAQRDRVKAELETVRGKASLVEDERKELERLKALEAEAEEKRQVQAGEFESAKKRLLDAQSEAEAKAKAAEERYARKVVESAFAGASDLFGPNGLTVLTPEFAHAGMGRHVKFVPGENGQPDGLQVLDLHGEVILGSDHRPASFAEGMRALIEQWPAKEQILRSGMKAGSGSTGGSGEAQLPVDRAELAERANRGDKAALKALRESQPRGIVTHGPHWEREAAAGQ